MSLTELTKVRDALAGALVSDEVNQVGRAAGQAVRLRTVTPHRLFLALVSALACGRVETLADLLRAFNHQQATTVAYKAFYNQLARAGFVRFMQAMHGRLIARLRLQTLRPEGERAVARFRDIVIQDGSSFAVKRALQSTFPGRFTTREPAAVEVHATYSGFSDDVQTVHVTPDTDAERPFLPAPEAVAGCLVLADRGYPAVAYFEAVTAQGGAFIVRLTRSHDPWICAVWVDGQRRPVRAGRRLARVLAQYPRQRLDVDVEYTPGAPTTRFRVVVLPGRDPARTRLCTNLPRTPFTADLVARLYRFRWQIELCFKEWKSYANLHAFDTANAHIAEGLIWASLCAAVLKRFLAHAAQYVGDGVAISTRRVAMCARHVLDTLVTAVLTGGDLLAELHRALTYLLANARRAHPKRDRGSGRLRAGLQVVRPA